MNLRTAIIGPTSYTGRYMLTWLLRHPQASVSYLASRRDPQPHIAQIHPQLLDRLPDQVAICRDIDAKAIAGEADVAFCCVPHKVAMAHVPSLLDAGLTVIDLSADYRTPDAGAYEKVYQTPHTDPVNLAKAVYGLPELFRSEIKGAKLIANPGCYPTAAVLAIAPLLRAKLAKPTGILVNASSGVTGAGINPKPNLHFPEQNEAYGPYGTLGGHRHQPELIQTLRRAVNPEANVLFVPHLLPLDQGILETIYLDVVSSEVDQQAVDQAMHQAYDHEPFVRLRGDMPNVKLVRDTNFVDLHARVVDMGDQKKIVVIAAIDNMIKGACGQAIQNMNLAFELQETLGLL